jgi:regulator of replication initiation timing|tara:strand:- start:222 stop:482 length:261 start_codon:yes stop_codon:yes gene_type:complete
MSKEVKKITEDQLKQIQDNQSQMATLINQIGAMEAQKQDMLAQVPVLKSKMDELKKELEEQYGAVNINVQDGSYEEIPQENLKKVD